MAALAVAGTITAWHGTIDEDRVAERDVGRWLANQFAPAGTFVTDYARVAWYAGHRPPPPRRFPTEVLVQRALQADVQFVAVRARRDGFREFARGIGAAFVPASLPGDLQRLADARGLVVFARR